MVLLWLFDQFTDGTPGFGHLLAPWNPFKRLGTIELKDLFDSMAAAGGIGLAAPARSGYPLVVVLYSVPAHRMASATADNALHRAY